METAQFTSLPVKFMPKDMQGAKVGLGAYITETNASGGSNILISPDLQGTVAFIDKCRNYGAILIVEKPEEEKKPIVQNLISLIGQAVGGACN
jgi:hypothetical protein